ncbi:hypothetical protein DFJ73DRAFT_775063 [Zopfochytrium polystomum]|nr:hypothetical protein DFJ73DRAFT_775063 [Zopfochytrium polystomum]
MAPPQPASPSTPPFPDAAAATSTRLVTVLLRQVDVPPWVDAGILVTVPATGGAPVHRLRLDVAAHAKQGSCRPEDVVLYRRFPGRRRPRGEPPPTTAAAGGGAATGWKPFGAAGLLRGGSNFDGGGRGNRSRRTSSAVRGFDDGGCGCSDEDDSGEGDDDDGIDGSDDRDGNVDEGQLPHGYASNLLNPPLPGDLELRKSRRRRRGCLVDEPNSNLVDSVIATEWTSRLPVPAPRIFADPMEPFIPACSAVNGISEEETGPAAAVAAMPPIRLDPDHFPKDLFADPTAASSSQSSSSSARRRSALPHTAVPTPTPTGMFPAPPTRPRTKAGPDAKEKSSAPPPPSLPLPFLPVTGARRASTRPTPQPQPQQQQQQQQQDADASLPPHHLALYFDVAPTIRRRRFGADAAAVVAAAPRDASNGPLLCPVAVSAATGFPRGPPPPGAAGSEYTAAAAETAGEATAAGVERDCPLLMMEPVWVCTPWRRCLARGARYKRERPLRGGEGGSEGGDDEDGDREADDGGG